MSQEDPPHVKQLDRIAIGVRDAMDARCVVVLVSNEDTRSELSIATKEDPTRFLPNVLRKIAFQIEEKGIGPGVELENLEKLKTEVADTTNAKQLAETELYAWVAKDPDEDSIKLRVVKSKEGPTFVPMIAPTEEDLDGLKDAFAPKANWTKTGWKVKLRIESILEPKKA